MSRGLIKPSLRFSLRSRAPSSCQCVNISGTAPRLRHPSQSIATSSIRRDEYATPPEERPRWQGAPERMYAPVRITKNYATPSDIYPVNTSSSVLNEAYVNVLGNGGDEVLTEEVKWLAVTHKSFDHGRRGYNDRLALLGKRIVELQTSLAILTSEASSNLPTAKKDSYGRTPYQHPALEGVEQLTEKSMSTVLDINRMASLADGYGLNRVLRWKPKNVHNLKGSGQPMVLCQTLYAIVGAVALQRGGEVANHVVHERILERLGLQQ